MTTAALTPSEIEKTKKMIEDELWRCPGIKGVDSAIVGPDGKPTKIGARHCGMTVRMEWFIHATADCDDGVVRCKGCAAIFNSRNALLNAEGMAREMGVSPQQIVDMRKWKEETREKLNEGADEEIDIMDGKKANDLMTGRKLYPVEGDAKCTNPHDQNKPLQEKIKENLDKTPPQTYSF